MRHPAMIDYIQSIEAAVDQHWLRRNNKMKIKRLASPMKGKCDGNSNAY